eukprot:746090-Hanusia_phi.AAC.10
MTPSFCALYPLSCRVERSPVNIPCPSELVSSLEYPAALHNNTDGVYLLEISVCVRVDHRDGESRPSTDMLRQDMRTVGGVGTGIGGKPRLVPWTRRRRKTAILDRQDDPEAESQGCRYQI